MIYLNQYEKMLQAFKNGDITETQWNKFCLCCLEELCENNSAVLKRLKNI